jgi:hypothetical protein
MDFFVWLDKINNIGYQSSAGRLKIRPVLPRVPHLFVPSCPIPCYFLFWVPSRPTFRPSVSRPGHPVLGRDRTGQDLSRIPRSSAVQHEKLYKKYIRKSLLTGSNDFLAVIINNLYSTAISQCNRRNRNVSKTFSFFFARLYTQLVDSFWRWIFQNKFEVLLFV